MAVQIKELHKLVKEHLPEFGQFITYGLQTKKKRKRELTVDFIVSSYWSSVLLVVPLGADGSIHHSFSIYGKYVFDSSSTKVLHLSRETLDWCCGEGGIAGIHCAYLFNQKRQGKGKRKDAPK